jgi:hypothetical protein
MVTPVSGSLCTTQLPRTSSAADAPAREPIHDPPANCLLDHFTWSGWARRQTCSQSLRRRVCVGSQLLYGIQGVLCSQVSEQEGALFGPRCWWM